MRVRPLGWIRGQPARRSFWSSGLKLQRERSRDDDERPREPMADTLTLRAHHVDPAGIKIVNAAHDPQCLLADSLAQNRFGCLQLLDS